MPANQVAEVSVGAQKVLRQELVNFRRVVVLQPFLEFFPICKQFQRSLGDVREGAMPKIVNERCQFHQSLILIREPENVAKQAGDMEHAKRMVEPGMKRAGIHQVRHRKLANAPETLEHSGFHDVGLAAGETDESVDWISNSSLFA